MPGGRNLQQSRGRGLIVLVEHGEFGLAHRASGESKLNRPTAHLAILNIGLLLFRAFDQYLYGLATVGALDVA